MSLNITYTRTIDEVNYFTENKLLNGSWDSGVSVGSTNINTVYARANESSSYVQVYPTGSPCYHGFMSISVVVNGVDLSQGNTACGLMIDWYTPTAYVYNSSDTYTTTFTKLINTIPTGYVGIARGIYYLNQNTTNFYKWQGVSGYTDGRCTVATLTPSTVGTDNSGWYNRADQFAVYWTKLNSTTIRIYSAAYGTSNTGYYIDVTASNISQQFSYTFGSSASKYRLGYLIPLTTYYITGNSSNYRKTRGYPIRISKECEPYENNYTFYPVSGTNNENWLKFKYNLGRVSYSNVAGIIGLISSTSANSIMCDQYCASSSYYNSDILAATYRTPYFDFDAITPPGVPSDYAWTNINVIWMYIEEATFGQGSYLGVNWNNDLDETTVSALAMNEFPMGQGLYLHNVVYTYTEGSIIFTYWSTSSSNSTALATIASQLNAAGHISVATAAFGHGMASGAPTSGTKAAYQAIGVYAASTSALTVHFANNSTSTSPFTGAATTHNVISFI